MKDRLAQFLQAEQMTASKFAESIGVQASSISHIMAGRNNPGYDFFYKLFLTYPRLNPNWMILGKGEMYSDKDVRVDKTHRDLPLIVAEAVHENIGPIKKIEKIIVFYTDKTFDTYSK